MNATNNLKDQKRSVLRLIILYLIILLKCHLSVLKKVPPTSPSRALIVKNLALQKTYFLKNEIQRIRPDLQGDPLF